MQSVTCANHVIIAFSEMTSLVEVRLPQNGIRPEGITALAEALAKNPDLEVRERGRVDKWRGTGKSGEKVAKMKGKGAKKVEME